MLNSITADETKELANWDQPRNVLAIYTVLQKVTDTRRKQGKRYSLALIKPQEKQRCKR